ncbi:unnamed protein product [Dicrocoelium dendriticum]|nr:unnamed protein product [Dicrocoelium dendriticum]
MESDGVIVEPAHPVSEDNVSNVDDLKRRSKGDGTENGDATSNSQTEELIVGKAKVVDIPEKIADEGPDQSGDKEESSDSNGTTESKVSDADEHDEETKAEDELNGSLEAKDTKCPDSDDEQSAPNSESNEEDKE